MDSINKEVCSIIIFGLAAVYGIAALIDAFDHKPDPKRKHENEQKAKVVRVERDTGKGCLHVFLDTDHHPKTAEACVKVEYGDDFPPEDIQQVISNNPERTVWEWKKWGVFSKLNEQRK